MTRRHAVFALVGVLALTTWGCSASSHPRGVPGSSTTTRPGPSGSPSVPTSVGPVATTTSSPSAPTACPAPDDDAALGRPGGWIQMVSSTIGYAVIGHTVAGTVDGRTWKSLYVAPEALSFVDAIDARHVWVVGTRNVFITSDGGDRWHATTGAGLPIPLTRVHFTSAGDGWGVGRNALLRGTRGGDLWTKVPSTPCPVQQACSNDGQHGWIATNRAVYNTIDGGVHWSRRLELSDPAFSRASALDVQCTPANAVWVLFDSNNPGAGSDGYAGYRCPSDAACQVVVQNFLTNAPPDTSGPGSTPGPFSVIDDHTAVFVGFTAPVQDPMTMMLLGDNGRERGPALVVRDRGPREPTPSSVSFASRDHGWIVDDVGDEAHILATTDGGKTWTVQYRVTVP